MPHLLSRSARELAHSCGRTIAAARNAALEGQAVEAACCSAALPTRFYHGNRKMPHDLPHHKRRGNEAGPPVGLVMGATESLRAPARFICCRRRYAAATAAALPPSMLRCAQSCTPCSVRRLLCLTWMDAYCKGGRYCPRRGARWRWCGVVSCFFVWRLLLCRRSTRCCDRHCPPARLPTPAAWLHEQLEKPPRPLPPPSPLPKKQNARASCTAAASGPPTQCSS